jgi:hypothetical protein
MTTTTGARPDGVTVPATASVERTVADACLARVEDR